MKLATAAVLIAAVLAVCGSAVAIIVLDPFHPEATISAEVEGEGSVSGTGSYDTGTVVTITAVPAAGHVFSAWSDGLTTPERSVLVETDVTFTAVFIDLNVVTVVCRGEGGTVAGADAVEPGETVTLTATTEYGRALTGWYDGETLLSAENPYTFTPTGDVTVTAVFDIQKFQVTVVKSLPGGGTVTGSGKIAYQTEHTVTTTVNSSYTFVGWYVGDQLVSTAMSYTFTVTEAVKLKATFSIDYVASFTYALTYSGTEGEIPATLTATSTLGIEVSSATWTLAGRYGGTVNSSRAADYSYVIDEPLDGTLTLSVKFNDGKVLTQSEDICVSGDLTRTITFYTEGGSSAVHGTNNLHCTVTYTISFDDYQRYCRLGNLNNGTSSNYSAAATAVSSSVNDADVREVLAQLSKIKNENGLSTYQYALLILRFTQALPYVYDSQSDYHSGSDYWNYPVQTLYEACGDCEDTSFLCATLWEAAGFQAAVLFCNVGNTAATEGHAMACLTDSYHGSSFGLTGDYQLSGNTKYYLGETTGKSSAATTVGKYGLGDQGWNYLQVLSLVPV